MDLTRAKQLISDADEGLRFIESRAITLRQESVGWDSTTSQIARREVYDQKESYADGDARLEKVRTLIHESVLKNLSDINNQGRKLEWQVVRPLKGAGFDVGRMSTAISAARAAAQEAHTIYTENLSRPKERKGFFRKIFRWGRYDDWLWRHNKFTKIIAILFKDVEDAKNALNELRSKELPRLAKAA